MESNQSKAVLALHSNILPPLKICEGSPSTKPAGKMAMVNQQSGEIIEVVNELKPGEEKRRHELMEKMKAYAMRYRKKHPNVKPDRLKRIVSKKFNVILT